VIARQALISPDYAEMQRHLHARPEGYGERGDKWARTLLAVVDQYGAGSVLDYGCGAGSLAEALRDIPRVVVREYDPAIPGKDALPSFADVVNCTDVLEHVEPDKLDAVLAHIRSLARKAVLLVVALVPTANVLPDGRNAHLIIRPANWWRKRVLAAGFTIHRPPSCARKKKSHEVVMVLEP
jgi:hypothetical protein